MVTRVAVPAVLARVIDSLSEGHEFDAFQALRALHPEKLATINHALAAALGAARIGDGTLVETFLHRALRLAHAYPRALASMLLNAAQIAAGGGRYQAATAYLEELGSKLLEIQASAPEEAITLAERASEVATAMGDDELATRILDEKRLAGQKPHPRSANLKLRAAHLLIKQGKLEAARVIAREALPAGAGEGTEYLAIGDALRTALDFAGAEEVYRQGLAQNPKLSGALAELGWILLFRGNAADALQNAELEIAHNGLSPRVRLLRAAARFALGHPPRALLPELDACVAAMPRDPETLLIRARIRSAAGEKKLALDDFIAAKANAGPEQKWVIDLELEVLARRHFNKKHGDLDALMAITHGEPNTGIEPRLTDLVKQKAFVLWDQTTRRLGQRAFDAISPELRSFVMAHAFNSSREDTGELTTVDSPRFRESTRILAPEDVLARLGENRSRTPTYVDPVTGQFEVLTFRPSARDRALEVQFRIRTRPMAALRPLFAAIQKDHPQSSHPYAYRGEAYLWLGQYAEAEADFRAGLRVNPRARWLHIGFGAVLLFQGDLTGALDSFARSIEVAPTLVGPTLYCYRAEARRKRGDLAGAITDLEVTLRQHPHRLSAWVNAFLAYDDAKKTSERDRAFAELVQRAPFLVADAAFELLGKSYWELDQRNAEQRRALVEHVLFMMRGNRSSTCITYLTKGGELRVVPFPPPDPATFMRRIRERL